MQSRIKNRDKKSASQLIILIQNQNPINQNILLTETPNSQTSTRKKYLHLFVALWPSTINHLHSKPTTTNRNITTHNPHHSIATNTTKEKTQTLQSL